MKGRRKLLTIAIGIALSIAAVASVSAYSGDLFSNIGIKNVEGFYTRITDTQGDIHNYEGVIDVEAMEKSNAVSWIASYEICQEDRTIIQVTLNDIAPQNGANPFGVPGTPSSNGYYAVKFELSAVEHTEVFLTGLTNANLDLIQEKLITAILENSQFTMESLDFIDAEKTDLPSDGDDLLCWAASTANMLYYTGWAEKAGYSGTDDLLDLFVESFTDVGSHQLYGLEWFFDGVYQMKDLSGWAQEKNPGAGGGYLKQYAAERVMNYVNMINQPKEISGVMDQLENGSGLGIGISWMDDRGIRNGGHAITGWGYICDKDFAPEDREYYRALIVSDSDSDMQADPNRRTAPNKLQVLNMSIYQTDQYDSWQFDGYGDVGVLEDFITLIPYSDDVEQETDGSATLDKNTSPDLVINNLILTNDALDTSYQGHNFTVGYLSAIPVFENTGSVDFTGPLDYTVEVSGSAAITSNYTYTGGIAAHGLSDENQTEKAAFLTGLPVGRYTLTITVNPDHTAGEAYYYNNKYTYDFVISKQHYSPPDVSLNAAIGEIQNGYAEAAITYPGLEEEFDFLRDPGAATYYLMRGYYANGAWQNWEAVDVSGEAPPDTCIVYAAGEQVRFRLLIEPKDPTMPVQQVYSEAYPLQYRRFEAAADDTNTAEPAPVERGVTVLKEGERFAFRIKNVSSGESGAAECNAAVYAVKGDEKIELFRKNSISLNQGESTETISVSSWDAELSGSYEVTVEVESASGNSETVLGTLRVGEKISYDVTIDSDITDPYDGETSLREAVANYREYGGANDRITIAEGRIIYLEQPIDIDYRIIIECPAASADTQSKGAAVFGNGGTQLFRVEQTGSLIITGIMLVGGYSKDNGGAVENNGGVVMLEQCMLFHNKSGLSGGAVYSNGGHIILFNCTLSSNHAGYGGAAGIAKDATINLVNCNVLSNSSNGGAIYNNSGTVNAIYSTFTGNSADSEGGGAITSAGTTNAAGCIITSNGSLDVSGKVNIFGSYITAADAKGSIDSLTQKGGCEEFFLLNAEGQPVWDMNEEELVCLFYLPQLSSRIHDGIYIKNDGKGKLIVSADGINWEATGINSAFSDEVYETDMLGNPHERLFGSYTKTCGTIQMTVLKDHSVMVYVPEAQDASLIVAGYSDNELLMDSKVYNQRFQAGTNRVTVSDIGGTHATAMLWDSMNSFVPLCEKRPLD